MSPSDIDDFLKMWPSETSRTFKYTDGEFIQNEYIKIIKYFSTQEDFYLVDGSSTYFPFDKLKLSEEEMTKLLSKKNLIRVTVDYFDSPRQLKTKGCECGAYVLKDNTYLHTKWCPAHKRDPGEWT